MMRSTIATLTLLLLIGSLLEHKLGAQSGSLSPLSDQQLLESTDTMETWQREGDQPPHQGRATYIQTMSRLPSGDWQLQRRWLDSQGAVTSVGTTVLGAGDLTTRFDGVRARGDSAAVVFAGLRATGWVVPEGQPPRLFDGVVDHPGIQGGAAELAFAASRPRVGDRAVVQVYSLYGAGPLVSRTDTLTATSEAMVPDGPRRARCVVVARSTGTRIWVDVTTGRILIRRGEAAGGRIVWWHVRRGLGPPPG